MVQRFVKILILMCCFVIIAGSFSVMALNISPGNDLFSVYSVAYKGMSWDLRGYHFEAERKGGKLTLWTEDKGADRFIKIIPHADSRYVFFQPQHSYFVADVSGGLATSGAELQLWDKGENNPAQMFQLIEVSGENSTYYIKNAKTDLYLTAHGQNKNITQEEYHKDSPDDQKWYFKKMSGTDMAPPFNGYAYALENVCARKFIDIPGGAPNQEKKDAELQLWSMDYEPDRYVEIYPAGVEDYFYIHPLHCLEVWDVEGGETKDGTDIQLWPQNNTPAQQFRFEYAGEPLTYYIKNRNSGKYVDAYLPNIFQDGCDIKIYTKNNKDNQKWKLHFYEKFQMPTQTQEFFIKAAYTNKFWDLRGVGDETNQNGKPFIMWDLDNEGDRKYKFFPSGQDRWINIQVQNGNRRVDITGNSTEKGARLHLWDPLKVNSQKFAIQFTSPTTFVLRTNSWKTADISCLSGSDWQKNGAELIQWDINYNKNQQFQLIYAAGPNRGAICEFDPIIYEPTMPKPQVVSENLISFNSYNLTDQQKELFNKQKIHYGYTFFPDSDGQIVLGISKRTDIIKIEEINSIVNVYVKETSLQTNDTSTIVKLQTKNQKIIVKDIEGINYGYFSLVKPEGSGWEVELAKKYAPQLRFHPDEISYPSPVEGIINRAYKVAPLTKDFTKLTTGKLPELAMNDNGIVLEIHRTTDRYLQKDWFRSSYSYEIHYRVGTLNEDGTIGFSGHRKLTTGVNPSIAINNSDKVVEAHRHSSNHGIDLRYGTLNAKKQNISFKAVYDITSGENPSVAINDSNLFIMVNERGDQLEYHFGRLEGENITFYGKKMCIPYKGSCPSVALNNLGQIVLTYEYNSKIYYLIGQFNENFKPIIFNKPTYLTTGNHSSIELNDAGDIIEVHETSNKHTRKNPNGDVGLYTMIHYRYGELRMNYGVANPYIEFSQYIELCSGVTPDIVINNSGDLVEIHETSSLTNSDLHYRISKHGYQRQTVTSLGDLPANQKGYILAQRGDQSWEAPIQNGKLNLKIYAVVSKVNDNIEIEYNFFYPQNGSNIIGSELLKHVGDWEKIYVTVDSNGNVIQCKYHHHAEATIFTKNQIQFVDGTHPVVYSALETHASYPSEDVSIKTGDRVSKKGLIWNSSENLEVVKIYGEIINNNNWIHWKGLWGTTLNSPTSKLWY